MHNVPKVSAMERHGAMQKKRFVSLYFGAKEKHRMQLTSVHLLPVRLACCLECSMCSFSKTDVPCEFLSVFNGKCLFLSTYKYICLLIRY